MSDENAVRRELLQVLDRCVQGTAPILAFRKFEADYTFEEGLSDDFRDQLDGLVLLAEEADWGLRGPEDFLSEARQILAAARSPSAAAGS